jgi:hypothetical protein
MPNEKKMSVLAKVAQQAQQVQQHVAATGCNWLQLALFFIPEGVPGHLERLEALSAQASGDQEQEQSATATGAGRFPQELSTCPPPEKQGDMPYIDGIIPN